MRSHSRPEYGFPLKNDMSDPQCRFEGSKQASHRDQASQLPEEIGRKSVRKNHCPDLYGLHFYRVTRTFHHHQTSIVSIFLDGPQNWGTKNTAYQRDTLQPFTASPRVQKIVKCSLSLGKNGWLEMIRPLVPKTRNDTAYWRFRPYFFRSPRP